MDSKSKLYYMLEQVYMNNYRISDFAEWFSIIYDHEINNDELSNYENELFGELAEITNRFSPFEEDLKIPNCYYSADVVREKAIEVYFKLKL